MKRLIAAVALSTVALSVSAVEIGQPYEEVAIERALPSIEFASAGQYVADKRAPYEELAIERALPTFAGHTESASVGSTQATQSSWANDYNFVAPAL